MSLRRSLHSIVLVGFLCAIFVAILWQGAPGYNLTGSLCNYVNLSENQYANQAETSGTNGTTGQQQQQADTGGIGSTGQDPVQLQIECCKLNKGDVGCKGFQTGGDTGAAPAPAPAASSASSCNVLCVWGTPDCSQPQPCPCGHDTNGNEIYVCPKSSTASVGSSASSNSSNQGNSGPAPAAPAVAPAAPAVAPTAPAAPPGFVGSSSAGNSSSRASSVSSASSSSSNAGGPPPPPPSQCPRMGFCGEICPGSFPTAMKFTLSTTQGQCSAEECMPIGGDMQNPGIVLRPDPELWDGTATCVFSATITPPTCVPPGTVGDKWVLKIYQDPQDVQNFHGFYYSDLELQGMAHFRGRSPWRCDSYNEMQGGGTVQYPQEPVCSVDPYGDPPAIAVSAFDDWCSSSSVSSSSSSSNANSSTSSNGVSSATSSTTSSSGVASSSSSSITTSSCDPLTCLLGGNAHCVGLGYSGCALDPQNPPMCHSCTGVRTSSSSRASTGSSQSSTGARFGSSSSVSSARSSQGATSSTMGTNSSSNFAGSSAANSSTAIAAVTSCGDSIVQIADNEACDDGPNNGDPSSGCTSSCLLADGQACTADSRCSSRRCLLGRCVATCVQNSDCTNGLACLKGACQLPVCGDGIVSPPGEYCDAGSSCTADGASCNRAPGTAGVTCLGDPANKNIPRKTGVTWLRGCVPPPGDCGNGILDTNTEVFLNGVSVNKSLRREQCDLGTSNGLPGSPCSATCTVVLSPFCGNGKMDAGEACDEGVKNGTPDSRCTSLCGITAAADTGAGNAFQQPSVTPGHTAASTYDLPLLPVRLPSNNSADLSRLSTGHAPVAKTGPEALLAIAMGAGFGWSAMRKRGSRSKKA